MQRREREGITYTELMYYFFNERDAIGRIKGIKGLKNRNREIKKSFLKKNKLQTILYAFSMSYLNFFYLYTNKSFFINNKIESKYEFETFV